MFGPAGIGSSEVPGSGDCGEPVGGAVGVGVGDGFGVSVGMGVPGAGVSIGETVGAPFVPTSIIRSSLLYVLLGSFSLEISLPFSSYTTR